MITYQMAHLNITACTRNQSDAWTFFIVFFAFFLT